jgi:hypothetical protein
MRRFFSSRLGLLLLIGVGAALPLTVILMARGSHPEKSDASDDAIVAPQRIAREGADTIVQMDASEVRSSDIRSVYVTESARPATALAYGSVLDLQTLLSDASSFDAAQAQLEAAEAKSRESAQAVERARALHADNDNVSRAQLQASESAYQVDQSSLRAAHMQLNLAQARILENWGPVLSKWVTERDGHFTRLVDVHEVLILATLPMGERWKEPVVDALATVENDRTVPLRFVSTAPRSDVHIQGVGYFFTAPGDSGLLPGLTVTLRASSGDPIRTAVLPTSAVVWTQGRPWAYERSAGDHFKRRPLELLGETGTGNYLVRPIPDHREIVVQGAQTLLSEEFRGQIDVDD